MNDLEWLARVMVAKLCGDRSRRFHVFRVYRRLAGPLEPLYVAGDL
jgi:hypothetical protein